MQIMFTPRRSDVHASYTFGANTVTATVGDVSETFNFTDVPDGEICDIDQGALPFGCVLRASKSGGEVTVTLVMTHDHQGRAPVETRFPSNSYTVAEAEALLAARDAALEAEDA